MTPLLFVHGACSTGSIWARQRRQFSPAEYPTLPDLAVSADHLIEEWAHWLARSFPSPHVIVAHSMGGAVAMTLARRYPHLVLGLVLVGTGPTLGVSPELLHLLDQRPEEGLAEIADRSLAPTAAESLRQASKAQILKRSIERARQEFHAANLFSCETWASEVVPPRAVIVGHDDLMTPPTLSQRFLIAWPETPLYEVAGAGHLVMLEQTERFNAILDAVL